MNEERRIKDRRVPPAVGDFALEERAQLIEAIAQRDARIEEQAREIERLMETFVKVADFLCIDTEAARKAPGKPSDVFIGAISALKAQQPTTDQDLHEEWLANPGDLPFPGGLQPSAGVVDERAEFNAAWPSIKENLPSHQYPGKAYSASDMEFAERYAADEAWWQARARLNAGREVAMSSVPFDTVAFAKAASLEMEKHDFHGFEPIVYAVVERLLAATHAKKEKNDE